MVLTNKKKVLTTHYILDTLRPTWERGVEFFVADFTQVGRKGVREGEREGGGGRGGR